MNGEVIGIVPQIIPDTKVEGVGYAIPMSTAKDIIGPIINQEVVSNDEASRSGHCRGRCCQRCIKNKYDIPSVSLLGVASNSAASSR